MSQDAGSRNLKPTFLTRQVVIALYHVLYLSVSPRLGNNEKGSGLVFSFQLYFLRFKCPREVKKLFFFRSPRRRSAPSLTGRPPRPSSTPPLPRSRTTTTPNTSSWATPEGIGGSSIRRSNSSGDRARIIEAGRGKH